MRRLCLTGLVLALSVLLLPSAARADDRPVAAEVGIPASPTVRPPGFTTDAKQALAIAGRQPKIRHELQQHPEAKLDAQVFDGVRWEVDLMSGDRSWAEVDLDSAGRVLNVYTGVAAASYSARGHFNDLFDKPWVWLTIGVLFLVPFVDPRRLRRLLHLDLLVLLSFGVSYGLLESERADAAVYAFYPPLLYLLGRMLVVGLRPRVRRTGRLVPVLPTAVLAVGVIALFGGRVALNLSSDRVIDIGYASVVGADRIVHKQELYVDNSSHGDTYGPIDYIAYVPFELAFPWTGEGVKVPAARAAAITFDLLTLVGLFLLGLRLRAGPEGRRLGLALAWAWAAFPFTLLGLMENTNDGLVAMLLVFALLAFSRPVARGAVLGLAVAAKFAPGGLLLLFARGRSGDGRRAWLQTVAACLGVFVFAMLVYLPPGGLHELWACTMGYQLGRPPDFSLWTMHPGIGWTDTVLEVLAVGLAVLVAVLPGRRTLVEISALAAAVTIALQLPGGHWFYFYIMWFAPLVLVALFAGMSAPAEAVAGEEPAEHAAPLSGPRPLVLAG